MDPADQWLTEFVPRFLHALGSRGGPSHVKQHEMHVKPLEEFMKEAVASLRGYCDRGAPKYPIVILSPRIIRSFHFHKQGSNSPIELRHKQ
jgi:hypothetical protein